MDETKGLKKSAEKDKAPKKSVDSGLQKNAEKKSVMRVVTAKDVGLSSEKIFDVKGVTFSNCVRALIQGWCQGTVASKGRSDVAFSNKKPWKQKGTGRARAGSKRSPLWRSGGVTFGPQARVRNLKVNRGQRRKVLGSLISTFLNKKAVISFNWEPDQKAPKTSVSYKFLKEQGLADKKLVIFTNLHDYAMYSSFANLPNVRLMLFDEPNVYSLSKGDYWVFLDKDFNEFKDMVSSWI